METSSTLQDAHLWQNLSLVCFDFDGTLVDASDVICRSFNEALEQLGQPAMADGAIRALIGRPLAEMFQVAVPNIDEPTLLRSIEAYREAFFPLAQQLSRPLPGALELLELFTARGVQLAIVTTRASDGARRILEGFGKVHLFQTIVGLEHVTNPKPDPEPIELALRRCGVTADATLMVGDTPDDMSAGRAAGVATLGVTSGVFDAQALAEAGAEWIVESLEKVVDVFRDATG